MRSNEDPIPGFVRVGSLSTCRHYVTLYRVNLEGFSLRSLEGDYSLCRLFVRRRDKSKRVTSFFPSRIPSFFVVVVVVARLEILAQF